MDNYEFWTKQVGEFRKEAPVVIQHKFAGCTLYLAEEDLSLRRWIRIWFENIRRWRKK